MNQLKDENMDFGGGFAVGIAAGIGSGMSIGASTAKKRAASGIRDYIDNNGITILDRRGSPIKTDQFLTDAVGGSSCCREGAGASTALWVLLGFLVLALGFGVAAFFMMT
jgi:hypothetical protein